MSNTLATLHRLALAAAGSDYLWNTDTAPSAKRSDEMRGLTDILANDVQGGICVACGDILTGAIQLCHVVASRRSGYGIMPGNAYAGHIGCNDDDFKVWGNVVPISSLVRADLLATEHPSRQACLTRDKALREIRDARRARRAALAGE